MQASMKRLGTPMKQPQTKQLSARQDQNSRPPELEKTDDNPILQHSVLPHGWPPYTHTRITNYIH